MALGFLKATAGRLVGVALAPAKFAGDLASSVAAHIKDKVDEPAIGSVVKHYLVIGAEHTGIYVGNGEIVHWTSDSKVEKCRAGEFKSGFNAALAMSIYVSCQGTEPVGSPKVANYALSKVGEGEKERGAYNETTNNCHMFVVECLTGKKCESRWEEPNEYCKQYLGADEWRVWKDT
ncbi:hypothetical protein HHE02_08480 [Helicobacter heilmannii]|uniref:hypothetical protein n=1 Tax=Helicobacter heilmannii TaxID=35817 RepID=UPI0006A084BD|nr:hypothetical protein [Helicobacter heilmannii]CRF47557.1 hypothetical protein HHE02_08480 [Helicobacter heilmannii]